MAVAGRARELILPLLFLPLSIPIVVGGVGASILADNKYLAFLALYDGVFVLLSWARLRVRGRGDLSSTATAAGYDDSVSAPSASRCPRLRQPPRGCLPSRSR